MNYKICKFCKRNIPIKANKCQYCGKLVKVDTVAIVILVAVLCLFFGGVIISSKNEDNSANDTMSTTEIMDIEQTQNENELQTEIITSVDDLNEKEYKENCKELYYDDVFFGKENLEGQYVKIHIFFSEYKYLTTDTLYSDTIGSIIKEYQLKRDFFEVCVLRKEANSYVGQQIEIFFSDNYQLNPSDYKTGEKAVIYGEVIHNATNTYDGYNQMWVVPKYIDME